MAKTEKDERPKRQRRQMAAPGGSATRGAVNGRARKTDEQVRAEGYTPFLRPEHTYNGAAFSVTGFNTEHRDGKQYIVQVADEYGDKWSLGVRKGSPDHRILHEALGPDWHNWRGGVIVEFRKGAIGDMQFVNVASADTNDPFV